MEAASAVRKISLDRLVLSPANARKTSPSAAEDAELKASTKARGLQQNLVVCPAAEGRGLHAVTAGGRRLKALRELAAEGVIPADCKVPCLVEEPDAARETSLIENTVRAAMHPADEFAAMAALIDAGEPIEAAAIRFGVTERHVKQRLRLGTVAPELLDEFRAGNLSLEVMTAFPLGADDAAQLVAWRQVEDRLHRRVRAPAAPAGRVPAGDRRRDPDNRGAPRQAGGTPRQCLDRRAGERGGGVRRGVCVRRRTPRPLPAPAALSNFAASPVLRWHSGPSPGSR